MNRQRIAQELVAVARELTADKYTSYWGRQFDMLDKKMPDYDAGRVSGFNKVQKRFRDLGIPSKLAGNVIAHWYNEYRAGNVGRDRAIRNIAKEMEKHKKKDSDTEGDPMAKERVGKMFVALHKWATKKVISLPSTAPVASQILEGLGKVDRRLRGKGSLKGTAAVEAVVEAMAGLFTVDAPPLRRLWRKYGDPVEEMLYKYRILP